MPTLDPSLLNVLSPQQLQNPAMTNVGRYVPPSFSYRRDNITGQGYGGGSPQMDWNQMQAFFLPQNTNNPFTQPYANSQQQLFSRFGEMFGAGRQGPGAGRGSNPTVPQFRDRQRPGGNQLSPYQMMAMQGRQGMGFDQMFDPRMMALFGGNGFGALKPTGPGANYGNAGTNANVNGRKEPMMVGSSPNGG